MWFYALYAEGSVSFESFFVMHSSCSNDLCKTLSLCRHPPADALTFYPVSLPDTIEHGNWLSYSKRWPDFALIILLGLRAGYVNSSFYINKDCQLRLAMPCRCHQLREPSLSMLVSFIPFLFTLIIAYND